jgi:transposase-like protein
MGKQSTNGSQSSIVVWDNLEEWIRRKVQEFIQSLLEEEITELLGRQKSERPWQGAASDFRLWDGHRLPSQGTGIGAEV